MNVGHLGFIFFTLHLNFVLNFDIGNSSLAITRKRQQLPFGLAITKERQLLKESSNCKTYHVLVKSRSKILIMFCNSIDVCTCKKMKNWIYQ